MNAKQFLTVDDFRAWMKVTEASRAELEAEQRRQAVDDVVRFVTRHMTQGRSLQQAGDMFFELSKSIQAPFAHTVAAREALVAMGWAAA
ncbi:hypothetical protein [Variovorax sp. 350MFTsu5.1]|uniref:hypothetical protein n=1 Tax=Variovorax sp. 350MFTsu5.1 TaxID=3158365 RepID=UPI003AAE638F